MNAAPRRLLDNASTAGELGVSYDWWMHNKKTLIAVHGFPAPVAGFRLWDPVAIGRWLDRQAGLPSSPAPVPAPDAAPDYAALLDGNARALAGAGRKVS